MAGFSGSKGVVGARPGTYRVRAHTKRTKTGITTVREHTASTALQSGGKSVRSPGLKLYMANKASNRGALIRAARLRALAHKY